MALAFWGRKSRNYMKEILRLYPSGEVDIIVDACMGSGSFSKYISCEIENVVRIAYELDRSLYVLHKVIKENYMELADRMIELNYSEERYAYSRQRVLKYNRREDDYEEIEIALDELVLLYFSYNNMRGKSPRRFNSYMKYDDAEKYINAKKQLESLKERFKIKAPGDVVELGYKWKNLEIFNDSFMNHVELWENSRSWIFIDPPYEHYKRGIKINGELKNTYLGYHCDMSAEEHEQFISKVIHYVREGKLKAKMIICTNYEVDDNGNLIIPVYDLYSKLIDYGFRRIIIQKAFCSNTYISTEKETKRKKHKKVEVVYINYETIN